MQTGAIQLIDTGLNVFCLLSYSPQHPTNQCGGLGGILGENKSNPKNCFLEERGKDKGKMKTFLRFGLQPWSAAHPHTCWHLVLIARALCPIYPFPFHHIVGLTEVTPYWSPWETLGFYWSNSLWLFNLLWQKHQLNYLYFFLARQKLSRHPIEVKTRDRTEVETTAAVKKTIEVNGKHYFQDQLLNRQNENH